MEIGTVSTSALSGQLRIGSGGTLAGNGTVIGDIVVEMGGTISPGFSPGLLNITGSLNLLSGSTLFLEVGGLGLGDFDRIALSGNPILGGNLSLRFINGFVPAPGSSFSLLTWGGSASGTFDSVSITGIDPLLVNFNTAGGSFEVNVVPGPGAASLLGIGTLLGLRRRR